MQNTKVKKILFIEGAISFGGSTVGLLNIIANLNKESYNFILACLYDGTHLQVLKSKINGTILLEPEFFKKQKLLKVTFLRIYHFFKLFIVINKLDIDLIHFNNFVYYPGLLAARLRRIPCISHLRSLPVDYSTHRSKVTFLTKFFSKFINNFIAISESIKKEYIRYGLREEKILVIGIGVPIEEIKQKAILRSLRSEFNISENKLIIGVISRFSWEKGLPFFIEALPNILKELKNTQCFIIGDGPMKYDLLEKIRSLSLNGEVIIKGWQENPYYILSALDVLIVPSLKEGRSRIITEALSLGVPVVASRVGGIVELINDQVDGLLIESASHSEISKAVIRLLKDENLRKKFSQNGIKKANEQFSIEREVENIEKVYQKVLKVVR